MLRTGRFPHLWRSAFALAAAQLALALAWAFARDVTYLSSALLLLCAAAAMAAGLITGLARGAGALVVLTAVLVAAAWPLTPTACPYYFNRAPVPERVLALGAAPRSTAASPGVRVPLAVAAPGPRVVGALLGKDDAECSAPDTASRWNTIKWPLLLVIPPLLLTMLAGLVGDGVRIFRRGGPLREAASPDG